MEVVPVVGFDMFAGPSFEENVFVACAPGSFADVDQGLSRYRNYYYY